MSIYDPAYQNYVNENYEPDDEIVVTDEEIAESKSEYESNLVTEKCSECSAEIKVYVGRDSDALSWKEVIREPKDEREKQLFELDPFSFLEREDFIKPEYLICRQCQAKQRVNPGDEEKDNLDEILF